MGVGNGMWGIERKAWWRRTAHSGGWGSGGVTYTSLNNPYHALHLNVNEPCRKCLNAFLDHASIGPHLQFQPSIQSYQ